MTRRRTPGAGLLDLLPTPESFAWLRRGEGLVGWGVTAQVDIHGADRFLQASDWWCALVDDAGVSDDVRVPGSGLVALGGFGFADEPGDSALVVPRVVVGRR